MSLTDFHFTNALNRTLFESPALSLTPKTNTIYLNTQKLIPTLVYNNYYNKNPISLSQMRAGLKFLEDI